MPASRLLGMKQKIIRYRTKPENTDENRRLVEAVFLEINKKKPAGLRYATIALEGGTFMHIVEQDDAAPPMSSFEAFEKFQDGVEERCAELPQFSDATIVGNYRMFAERT